MSSVVSQWDNEYAKLARLSNQLKTLGSQQASASPQDLHQGLARLENQLPTLGLSASEQDRRRRLIQGLQGNSSVGGGGSTAGSSSLGGYNPPQQQQSRMQMAMQQQDDMIDSLAVGVGRLKDQTTLISDEARLYNRLLDDMEGNLDAAHDGLDAETRRAARLREDKSVWKLQLTVAGLAVLLVLEIMIGLN
jgi:hypothetical protein